MVVAFVEIYARAYVCKSDIPSEDHEVTSHCQLSAGNVDSIRLRTTDEYAAASSRLFARTFVRPGGASFKNVCAGEPICSHGRDGQEPTLDVIWYNLFATRSQAESKLLNIFWGQNERVNCFLLKKMSCPILYFFGEKCMSCSKKALFVK